MSVAGATSTLWTVRPLMVMPRIREAWANASSAVVASFTPPALPRPPAWSRPPPPTHAPPTPPLEAPLPRRAADVSPAYREAEHLRGHSRRFFPRVYPFTPPHD